MWPEDSVNKQGSTPRARMAIWQQEVQQINNACLPIDDASRVQEE